MDRNIIEALLDRYLKGETSQEENELVENWLEDNDNPHSEWTHLDQNSKDQWLTGVFGQIQDSIRANEPKSSCDATTQAFMAAYCCRRGNISYLFYAVPGMACIAPPASGTVNRIDGSFKSTKANYFTRWK